MRRVLLLAAGIGVALGLGSCGEKITVPIAPGIPGSTGYFERSPWELTDPTDAVEALGKLFVVEGGPGTLRKYNTRQDIEYEAVDLREPIAVVREKETRLVIVLESGGATDTPRLSFFEESRLEPQGDVELAGLVQSVRGIAASPDFLYISDPDSGVVHRFSRDTPTSIVAQGVVADNQGSSDSPNFIFEPSGITLDEEGMLLICDADTTRNWVVRFDPTPPVDDPTGKGQSVLFRPESCLNELPARVLGLAPGCGETGVQLGPSDRVGAFFAPTGVALDTEGSIYVADRNNGRIQRFGGDGAFDLLIGADPGDGTGLETPFRVTTWLGEVFREGRLIQIPGARIYVVDRSRAAIRIFEDDRWSEFEQ